jgi:PAS domain-containing protein
MSENVAPILGYPPESFADQPAFWAERIHPSDLPDLPSDLRLPAPGGVRTLLYRFRHSDGKYRWVSDKVKVERVDQAGFLFLVGSLTDLTEQLEGEQKFMTLAERSPSLILITRGSRVLFANNGCEKFLGIPRPLVGAEPFDWIEKVAPESRQLMRAFLSSVETGKEVETPEVVFPGLNESPLWCIVTGALVPFEGELATLVIATDVTQLHHLEEQKTRLSAQIQQAQKMEAVGRLAGGIAHDFNNMLMVIQGFTDFLQKKAPADSPERRYFDEIRKATERAASWQTAAS